MSEEEQTGASLIKGRYKLKLEKQILTLTNFFFPIKKSQEK